MKLKFKTIVLFSVSFLYLISTLAIFFVFNDFYLKTTIKKFIDENQYSASVVYDYIEQEKKRLITSARVAGSDEVVMHAFKNKVYIKVDSWTVEDTALKLGIVKVDRLKYILLANVAKDKLFGGGRGSEEKSIAFYDNQSNLAGYSSEFPKEFLDTGKEKYISSCQADGVLGGVELSLVQKKGDDFFLKGLSPLGKNWRTSQARGGVVVVGERMDGQFFDTIKKMVNKEIILFSENEMITSTLFKNVERITSSKINTTNNKGLTFEGKNYFFTETIIDNKKMGITYFIVNNFYGEEIARIGVGFSYESVEEMYKKNLWSFIAFSALFTLILFIILYFIMKKLFNPFNKILDGVKEIKEGRYDKKIEVRNRGELSLLADSLNNLTEAVENREIQLKDVTESVRNLLNNAGQGFLSFGKDMIIGDEYSKECVKIFGMEIKGKKITDLLFGEDTKQINFVESILQKILSEKEKAKLYFPLVPDNVIIGKRTLSIEFKILEEKSEFMLVITDITEKKLLENQMEKERNILKMAVNAATQKTILLEIMKEYKEFYSKDLNEILQANGTLEDISFEIFRRVHTLKGNVNQINLISLAKKLHDFENKISNMRGVLSTISKSEFIELIKEEKMEHWIEPDKKLLKEILGDDFFEDKEDVVLGIKELEKLEKKAKYGEEIISDIRKLQNKSLKKLIEPYIKYSKDLALRLGKVVRMHKITGDDISVDEKYYDFVKTLVHIFRNGVDHGIEKIDERVSMGKESAGTIKCNIQKGDNEFKIIIEDDGNGIDVERIAAKAIEKGVISEEEKQKKSRGELLLLIFYDEMTTKDEITSLSGRGEGLSAVKKEVERLEGKIEVLSEKGIGTKFIFTIPYRDIKDIANIEGRKILKEIIRTASKFFNEEGKIEMKSSDFEAEKINHIELYKVSAYVNLTGIINAELLISAEEGVASKLLETMVMSETPVANKFNLLEGIMEESTNVIVGNSMEIFKDISEYITVSPPRTILSDKTIMKYPGKDIWSYTMDTDCGKISYSIITNAE